MALREGAALDVLARQADRVAFGEERAEGERLRRSPSRCRRRSRSPSAGCRGSADGLVEGEAFRDLGQLLADRLQLLDRNAGVAAPRRVAHLGDLHARPGAVEPVGLVRAVVLAGLELGLELGAPVGLGLVDVGGREQPLVDQLLAVDLERRRMRGDRLVHQRLGEGRLVALVVAVAAIAEHVDDHRLVELLPELGGDLGGIDDRFRVVAVAMEDRRLDHLGDVRWIGRGARESADWW